MNTYAFCYLVPNKDQCSTARYHQFVEGKSIYDAYNKYFDYLKDFLGLVDEGRIYVSFVSSQCIEVANA